MSRLDVVLAAIAASVLMRGPAASAPLEAYGRLPNIEQVSLSPDGLKMGLIWTTGEQRRVAIRDLATGDTKMLGVGEAKVRHLDWAGADHLLITTTSTAVIPFIIAPRAEWTMIYDYSLVRGTIKLLLSDADQSLNVTNGPPVVRMIDGKPAVFLEGVHFVDGLGQDALYRVDPETGKSKLVHPGFANTVDWVVGPDGKPLAEAEYDRRTSKWTMKVAVGGGWREVKTMIAPLDRPILEGLGRDGASVLVAEPLEKTVALREVSPTAPVWTEPFRNETYATPIFDPGSNRLIGSSGLVGDEQRYQFFDPADVVAWGKIERAYKGMRVQLTSWSADRGRVIVRVDSPTDGSSYAFIDFKTRRADPIGAVYQDLRAADIAEVRSIRYHAKDGREITGYLTLPKGREPKDLPLVVLPHGGPAARDEPGFDWWSQALASRGYAVLQPNFRGSDGFGGEFLEAGFGEWGRKMQTDLSDGVRDLVRQGLADPKRVCIVGASYGGYAALAGAALDPGVYRCAASVAGISDLRRFVVWSKQAKSVVAQRYWIRFMGAEDPKDPVLGDISPALHADQVSIPILLIHGKDDTVVPLEQSQIMEKALKGAGKPVELVVMPGEDHWLSRGATRLQMLRSVVAFLEKNNPPQ